MMFIRIDLSYGKKPLFQSISKQGTDQIDIAVRATNNYSYGMYMEKLQLLVVSASESRKALLVQQFAELGIDCPIRYLEAKVLDAEAPEYVPSSASVIDRRIILSTRTHIRAVEIAGLDSSPDFSLIVEDDIALHRADFKKTLTHIPHNYDSLVARHSDTISLGWIPCNNTTYYKTLKGIPVTDTYSIHTRFTPGTQAYLLKRSKAKEMTPLLKHDTYISLRDKILSLKNPLITSEKQMKAFDEFGTKLLNQCILYPPLSLNSWANPS